MVKTLIHSGKVGLEGLKWEDRAEQPAGPFEIKIKVKAAGLNHRDLFALSQVHEKHPVVIGSDAAGVVVAVGAEVTRFKIGDEVMLYPGSGWRKNSDTAPENFTILGSSEQGAMAEEIVVSEENAVHKPAHLSWEEAGVLSLSALTAYRALFTKGGVSEGMKVLIPGIGGGVATYLLQFAKAAGATVYVTSRSQEKLGTALQHGADKGLLHDEDWVEAMGGKSGCRDRIGRRGHFRQIAGCGPQRRHHRDFRLIDGRSGHLRSAEILLRTIHAERFDNGQF
jgi:zinc-binding alcohol dehydrogenase/oxidoreductase